MNRRRPLGDRRFLLRLWNLSNTVALRESQGLDATRQPSETVVLPRKVVGQRFWTSCFPRKSFRVGLRDTFDSPVRMPGSGKRVAARAAGLPNGPHVVSSSAPGRPGRANRVSSGATGWPVRHKPCLVQSLPDIRPRQNVSRLALPDIPARANESPLAHPDIQTGGNTSLSALPGIQTGKPQTP